MKTQYILYSLTQPEEIYKSNSIKKMLDYIDLLSQMYDFYNASSFYIEVQTNKIISINEFIIDNCVKSYKGGIYEKQKNKIKNIKRPKGNKKGNKKTSKLN